MNVILEFIVNIGNAISGLGSTVMVPIIIVCVGLFFQINWKSAIRSGLMVGAGFIGLSLVTKCLSTTLGPAAKLLFDRFNLDLQFVDAGWAAAAGIGFATPIGTLIIPTIIAFNMLMLTLKLTKTVNIDIWNYWHYAFIGSLSYSLTGSLYYGFIGALVYCAFSLRMADYTAKDVEEVLGLPGISIPQAASIATAPIAILMEAIYNRIPGFKDLKTDAGSINKKLGTLGDPIVIGFTLGLILGFIVGYDFKGAFTMGINLGAVMLLLPRMVKVVMEGLIPISEAARKFMQSKFSGKEYYIGMDSAVTVGHPTTVAVSILIVPVYILFTIIIPGNQCLPFGALAGTIFVGAIVNLIHKGDLLRTMITSTILVAIGLLGATYIGPMVTDVAMSISYEFPAGASAITYYSPSGWLYFVILSLIRNKIMGTSVLLAITAGFFWLTRDKTKSKKSVSIQ